jgi:4-alpha-glucanotransferase
LRSSGILLPISSLPSPYGIGSLGTTAFQFADFLQDAGQRFWQILPIGPTGYGDSPYQSFSSFAGNPYFIDLDILTQQGLLKSEEIASCCWGNSACQVDYEMLYQNRFSLLRLATSRMDPIADRFILFCNEEAEWLVDYALFMAIKTHFKMTPLSDWPTCIRMREEETVNRFREDLAAELLFWQQIQFLFYQQWWSLKTYACLKGIRIIGDIPVYVSPDSSDLWANPELFQTDEHLNLIEVAGCPPDAFSPEGQLWGNPLYDWPKHQENGYHWWVRRLRHAGRVYDTVRIDHFIGLERYYSIPGKQGTAVDGHWRPGPGRPFIDTIKRELPDLHIIAEDLGVVTPEVKRLLAESGFPGMKVLQFAFDSREGGDYMPYHCQPNSVVYTGTHDNTTTEDWQHSSPADTVCFAKEFMDVDRPEEFTWRFIRMALATPSDTCIIPLQDYLGLGAEARINTPSTKRSNWRWRVDKTALTAELAERIRYVTNLYGRIMI